MQYINKPTRVTNDGVKLNNDGCKLFFSRFFDVRIFVSGQSDLMLPCDNLKKIKHRY